MRPSPSLVLAASLGGLLLGVPSARAAAPAPATVSSATLSPALFTRVSYTDGDGVEVLDAIDVAGRVRAAPAGKHLVWVGTGWVDAKAVPAVAEALSRGLSKAPPPLPDRWKYALAGKVEDLTLDEIAARVQAGSRSPAYVWRPGYAAWAPASTVPEVAAAVAARPPAPAAVAPPVAAAPPVAVAPSAAASSSTAEAPDPAAAIRAHLHSLGPADTSAVQAATTVEATGPAPGDGPAVYEEAPPLPGEGGDVEIVEIPPDQVEEILRAEGLTAEPAKKDEASPKDSATPTKGSTTAKDTKSSSGSSK